jgi:hypothetical protein
MTTLSRGDERAALFHVLLNVIEMDIDDHLNIIQALSEKRCDGIYDFLLLDGETVDKLARTDKNGSVHPSPIGYLYSLHRFRAFVAYRHTAGTPISPDEWLHLTWDEYADYCEDLMQRHTGSRCSRNIETLAESKQFDFVLADFYLSTVPYDDYDDITIEVDYDFSDYDNKTVEIDYIDTNTFDIAPLQHDEPTTASSSDQTSILLHRQPDPSVFVNIDEADEFPCFDDSDMIEECILHRTHDFKSTMQNGVSRAIDDNMTIQPYHPATKTYGDTISVHFFDCNDQNQTFDGDPHLNTSIMRSSNDSTANKTNILCIRMGSRSYGTDSAISYDLSAFASSTKFVSTMTLSHLLITHGSPKPTDSTNNVILQKQQGEDRDHHLTPEILCGDIELEECRGINVVTNVTKKYACFTWNGERSTLDVIYNDDASSSSPDTGPALLQLRDRIPKEKLDDDINSPVPNKRSPDGDEPEHNPELKTEFEEYESTIVLTDEQESEQGSELDQAGRRKMMEGRTSTVVHLLRDDGNQPTSSSENLFATSVNAVTRSHGESPTELCMGRPYDTKVQECCHDRVYYNPTSSNLYSDPSEQKTQDGTFNLISPESISDEDSNQSLDSDPDSATDHKPSKMELAYGASDKRPTANKAIDKNATSVNELATSHVSVQTIHCTDDHGFSTQHTDAAEIPNGNSNLHEDLAKKNVVHIYDLRPIEIEHDTEDVYPKAQSCVVSNAHATTTIDDSLTTLQTQRPQTCAIVLANHFDDGNDKNATFDGDPFSTVALSWHSHTVQFRCLDEHDRKTWARMNMTARLGQE